MMTANDLLAVLPDPLAEAELRRQLAREAYERGRADGWYEGHETAERAMAAGWLRIARPVARGGLAHEEIEGRRWHVCCPRCRRLGHQQGCEACEDRDRETFGRPHADDYQGRTAAA